MSKFAVASGVLVLSVALCSAENIRAVVAKVDGNKVTFHKLEGKGDDAKKGEAQTLPLADGAKIIKGKFNEDTKKTEDGDALEGGLKNEVFAKETRALVVTSEDGKSITKIRVGGRKK